MSDVVRTGPVMRQVRKIEAREQRIKRIRFLGMMKKWISACSGRMNMEQEGRLYFSRRRKGWEEGAQVKLGLQLWGHRVRLFQENFHVLNKAGSKAMS